MNPGVIDSGQKIITRGLVFHVDAAQKRSYSGSGTAWNDLSGNGNNGTLINGPTFDSGNGGSITFDGIDEYASFGNDSSLETYDDFTYELWTYYQDNSTGGAPILFYKLGAINMERYTDSNPRDWLMYCFGLSNPGYYTSGINIADDNWYQLVFVRNKTNQTVTFYTNNVKGTEIGSITGSITSGTGDLEISTQFSNNSYKGKVSIARIYNVALTETEIGQNWNANKIRYGL
jgi:hypothetical protein